MDIQAWALLGMIIAIVVLWAQVDGFKAEAFKWRKRWIIERFGAGVEGTAGDYFVVISYSNGVPCLLFAKHRKDLAIHGTVIRKWDSFMGKSAFGEDCDMPDEKSIGLPHNPSRDNRAWVASGPGLCRLPPSIHERAQRDTQ